MRPWVAHSVNVIATGLLQADLQKYLRNPAHGVVPPHEHRHPDLDLVRPLLTPLVFDSRIALAFFVHPFALRIMPGIIRSAKGICFRRRHRRLKLTYTRRVGPKHPAARH